MLNVIVIALCLLDVLMTFGMLVHLKKQKAYMAMAMVMPLAIFALLVAGGFGMVAIFDALSNICGG